MKGIVLETNDKEAVVLFDNGTASKIKNKHYEKGQVVNMNNKFKFMVKAGSIVAALAITTATGFAYTTPATYVSLDVNPSIEYQLNAFDRVISVIAVNEDGEKIVNELDVNNEKIQKAILKTVEKLKAEGYLTDEDYAGIVIAVSNKNEEKSEKLTDEIEEELNEDDEDETALEDEEKEESDDENKADTDEESETEEDKEETEEIEIVVEAVGRERVEEARELNVTPGKLNLVQKLIASTDDFDDINEEQLKELLGLSVKEINKMTQAYRKGLDVESVFVDDLEEDLDEEALEAEEADVEENQLDDEDNEAVNEGKDEDDDKAKEENDKEKNNGNKLENNNKPEEKEKSNNGNALGKSKNN